MGDYLVNLVFAEDLLNYILQLSQIDWESPHKNIFRENSEKRKFNTDVGSAVRIIWEKNEHDFSACYFELRNTGIHNKEDFSKYALSAVNSYFTKGYNPGSFLGYCAIVLVMASHYFEFPSNGVPETAVGVVALVLFAHQLTGQFYLQDGWEGIHKTSRLLCAACSNT